MQLGSAPRRRRPSLTPMIDVVFLLLVFFMLASRFGGVSSIPLARAGGAPDLSGPPRLIGIGADELRLNGIALGEAELVERLNAILPDSNAAIVLRPNEDVSLQRLISVLETLRAAGFPTLSVLEGG